MEHDLYIISFFGIKEKSIFLTHTVFLAIATIYISDLKTGFVVQGHI